MKRWIRIGTWMLALALMIVIAPALIPEAAAAVPAGGISDDGLSWSLSETGVLTISGEGPMADYEIYGAPWHDSANYSRVKQIVITDGITSIGKQAFYGCRVTEITFGKDVQSIGEGAFRYCTSLKQIEIPDTVTYIGPNVFEGCKALTKLTVPFIGDRAVAEEMSYPLGYFFGTTSYSGATATRQYTCSSSGSKTLASYYIPNSLVSVTVTGGALPYGAFYYCSNLQEVHLGDGVTEVGSEAFWLCSKLATLSVGKGITAFQGGTFTYCNQLKRVNIADIESWCKVSYGALALQNGAALYLDGEQITGLVIPEGVKEIAINAFGYCSALTSVTLPASMERVSDYAFSYCSGIQSVKIGDGVKEICESAFIGCRALTELDLGAKTQIIGKGAFAGCSALQQVRIPSSVTSIGYNAFVNCTQLKRVDISSLESWCNIYFEDGTSNPVYQAKAALYLNDQPVSSLVIPEGVTQIGANAFINCSSITAVYIPDSVTEIGLQAFACCANLTKIYIGKGVERIGYYALSQSPLSKIVFFGDAPAFGDTNMGTDVFYGVTATAYYPAQNSTWTSSVRQDYGGTITWSEYGIAFKLDEGTCGTGLNWKLTADGILTISGSGAMDDYLYGQAPWFGLYNRITALKIEEGVNSVGAYAFADCVGIVDVKLPESLEAVGECAFSPVNLKAEALKLKFAGAAPAFAANAFLGHTVTAQYPQEEASWTSAVLQNYGGTVTWESYSANELGSGTCGTGVNWVLTKDGVLTISGSGAMDDFAYDGAPWKALRDSILKAVIGDGVTHIGEHALHKCYYMTHLTLPAGNATVGYSAFEDCHALTTVVFPEGITALSDYAFRRCKALESIPLPQSLTELGYNTFDGCVSLKSVQIPSKMTVVHSWAFANCSALETVVLPEGVTEIGEYAFSECTALANVNFPSTLQRIGNRGFARSEGLTRVELPDSITYLGGGAFRECPNLVSVKVSEGVQRLRSYTFYQCSALREVTLPAALTAISTGDFRDCTALTTVYFTGTKTQWEAVTVGSSNEPLLAANMVFAHTCAESICPVCGMINAPQAGEVVCLTQNVTAAEITVSPGTILDLQGFSITADKLVSFGDIVDTTGGGSLAAGEFLLTENSYLPLYDAENSCYRFFDYEQKPMGVRKEGSTATFAFAPVFEDASAYELLTQTGDSGLQVTLTLQWNNGQLPVVFSNDLLREYAALQLRYPGAGAALLLKVTGLDSLKEGETITVMPGLAAVAGQLTVTGTGLSCIC